MLIFVVCINVCKYNVFNKKWFLVPHVLYINSLSCVMILYFKIIYILDKVNFIFFCLIMNRSKVELNQKKSENFQILWSST